MDDDKHFKTPEIFQTSPNIVENEKAKDNLNWNVSSIWIKNSLNNITIIGLNKILDYKSTGIRQVLWSSLMIISFGFFCFQVQDRISYYYTFETITRLRFLPIKELRFPTVTICNENKIIQNKLLDQINGLLSF